VAYDLQPFQEVHPVQICTRLRNPIAAELWSATTSKSCRGLYNRGSSTDQMRRWGDGHESVWTLRTSIISYPQNSQTLKHREHDAHDDPSGILINVRGPTSWNNCSQQYHLAVTSPHYLDVAISRGGGQQLITSGGHGHVPAVTKTGLLSANFLTARMAKWTLNGFLLCSASTMQPLDKCVYVYIYILYMAACRNVFSQNRAKLLFRWGPATQYPHHTMKRHIISCGYSKIGGERR
jgi:hypothetical protein